MTLIEMKSMNILLECGLFQSNNIKNDWKINSGTFDFKPSNIDYIFIGHGHIDHIGLLPRLYAEGCKAKIIAPKGTAKLFSLMGMDSAYIISKDAETLNRKYKMSVTPYYTENDVLTCLKYFEEYDMENTVVLNDNITFNFLPSGHIINSAQIELWLTENNRTSKILYTSDLGNISVSKNYVNDFIACEKANLVIAESTYSDKSRSIKNKDRNKDLEKIKSIIDNVCLNNKHKVLIPIFSLDRCQNILTHLYNIYGHDNNFNIPIYIDSPLSIKITELYRQLLSEEELLLYEKILNWNNVNYVQEYKESKALMDSQNPMIILSASGMMQAGRSKSWAKSLLPDGLSHILFVGYSSENSLGSLIKNGKKYKTLKIDGQVIPNRCGITNLLSFSSHMQYEDMLKYYSNINCEKIALVHGDFKQKCVFAKKLQETISNKNKTSKVVCVNKNTEILI